MKTKAPRGALTMDERAKARWVVYRIHAPGAIGKRNIGDFADWWFIGSDGYPQMGYAFENYFHAHAYSVKLKAIHNACSARKT